ncbi:MAG: hypothetical protein AB7O24_14940 [Kofleriaceae bacterium]
MKRFAVAWMVSVAVLVGACGGKAKAPSTDPTKATTPQTKDSGMGGATYGTSGAIPGDAAGQVADPCAGN